MASPVDLRINTEFREEVKEKYKGDKLWQWIVQEYFVRQCEVQVQEMLVEEHLEHEMMMED